MATRISIRRGTTVPTVAELGNYEIGFCTTNGIVYVNNNGTIQSLNSGGGSGHLYALSQISDNSFQLLQDGVPINPVITIDAASTWSELSGKPFSSIDNHTLVVTSGVLKVKTTNDAEQDNTLPITSAGVDTIVGNIKVLLETI